MNKRYIALTLTMIMLVCLAACKKDAPDTTEQGAIPSTAPVETTVPEQIQESIVGDGVIIGAGVEEEEETTAPTEETTAPTEDDKSEETTAPTEDNKSETTAPTEDDKSDETTAPTEPAEKATSYEEYMNMSAAEQAAFIESFESMDAFMAWFNNAKAEYDSTEGSIEIGSGSVDLGDIIGGN